MNTVYGGSAYTDNSIIFSRLSQENISLSQGVTGYGVIANLIAMNIDEIDRLAEYAGGCFSQQGIEKKYVEQYGKNGLLGRAKRLFIGDQRAYENQADRRALGFLEAMTIEGGIKLGARVIQKWTGEKEKYQCLDQVYRILRAYAKEDPAAAGNPNLIRELNKIRNSFPLSAADRLRLSGVSVDGMDVFQTDFPVLQATDSQDLRRNIAYLLYVLYAQKYGAATENEVRLLEYYDLLGFRSWEGIELLRENKNSYDTITVDQLKYLMVARGMVKELAVNMPRIDVSAVAQRTAEMAKNDPYRIRKKKELRAPIGGQKRISDLFFESPMVVINAGATALSQFDMDDDAKENTVKVLTEWGVDQGAISNIMEGSDSIKAESNEML